MISSFADVQQRANFYKQIGHCDHLIHVSVNREWCCINGETQLKFKTRGNNERDLREALIKYDIDYLESELEQCAKEISHQLYLQAARKHEPLKLEAIA